MTRRPIPGTNKMKITKQRLREIIKEEFGEAYSLEEWTKEQVKGIMADRDPGPERSAFFAGASDDSGDGSPREPWEGIEENAERLDILSNQIGALARALGVEL